MVYSRKIYKTLEENIDNNKIIILTGSRQVGKTTLLRMLEERVAAQHKTVFLDMDIVSNHDMGERLESLLDFLTLNGYAEKLQKFFLFIDEFQRVPRLANVLKNLYDHYPNIKIFASGSSSLAIKSNIKESLAGRKFVFNIYPLDFEEFLGFKGDPQSQEHYRNIGKLKSREIDLPAKINDHLCEFITFGGYPEVVLANNEANKKQILKSIFDLYIEKDVMTFMGVENIWAYKKLIQLLAVNSGQIVSYNNLANEAEIHNKTVRSYLDLIEETFLIKTIRPYHSNKTKEIKKAAKVYFQDNGVRNFFLNNFNSPAQRVDAGQMYESYVLQELIKNSADQATINFWRTKQQEEVDFILGRNGKLLPVEVKRKAGGKLDDYRYVRTFMETYKQKKGFVLSTNYNAILKKRGADIHFLPIINFVNKL